MSQGGKVESSGFWCFKDFEFLATALVNTGGGIRNRKGSITDESEKTIGQKLLAGATSIIEKWSLSVYRAGCFFFQKKGSFFQRKLMFVQCIQYLKFLRSFQRKVEQMVNFHFQVNPWMNGGLRQQQEKNSQLQN